MHRSSNLIESRKCFLEHFRNNYLINALYDAVIDADISTIKFLLEFKKVNPNLLIPEYDAAPLHAAPGIGSEEMAIVSINMLLDHGANPNIVNSEGTTPLMISCLWGRYNVVKLLLNNGANPFLEDLDGMNCFSYALESDEVSIHKLLTEFPNTITSFERNDPATHSNSNGDLCSMYKNNNHIGIANNLIEFTDIDSDANVVEFYSLNTAFRHNACKSWINESVLSVIPNENDNVLQKSELSNNNLNYAMISPNISQNTIMNREEESEENSFVSLKSSQVSILSYATDHLKQELKRHKIMYGPVTRTTKKVYQNLLSKVIKGKLSNEVKDDYLDYPEILRSTFKEKFMELINKWYPLEKLLSNNFSDTKKVWRGGKEKQFFTYLLLDPFITNNIPLRRNEMKEVDIWKTFVLSIFYVGKGKNSRPFSHLYEALRTMNKKTSSKKVKRIQTIWDKSAGVICLHIFHNIITAEAHTREAAMIDAIGSNNLTNIQSGEYYGVVKNWSIKQKRQLGVVLLYKALQIYLAEGERQIFATDLT